MSVSDPIADMLTRIRNAEQARHDSTLVPLSNIKLDIARILKEEGFIVGYDLVKHRSFRQIKILLKYDEDNNPVITGLERISKPGCRVYKGKEEIPWVLSGIGVAILSTPKGLLTDRQARRLGVGGEVLCYVW